MSGILDRKQSHAVLLEKMCYSLGSFAISHLNFGHRELETRYKLGTKRLYLSPRRLVDRTADMFCENQSLLTATSGGRQFLRPLVFWVKIGFLGVEWTSSHPGA